ncbi:MAG: hypothetical protein M1821_005429 [Bathelium mastoideum]|nr:MAG: hypothetical protein M1821_005429 [Bathelium mastoideum]
MRREEGLAEAPGRRVKIAVKEGDGREGAENGDDASGPSLRAATQPALADFRPPYTYVATGSSQPSVTADGHQCQARSSLWLVPPADAPIAKQLSELIAVAIPAHFAHLTPPQFAPHITLTSEIDPQSYGNEPQEWLNQQISVSPASQPPVIFETLDTEQPFFRKLTIRVEKHPLLTELARACRAVGVAKDQSVAQKWVEDEYRPHCSLMYADTSISQQKLGEVKIALEDVQIKFKDTEQPRAGSIGGWVGGTVWLVPTDRDISMWQPIATRDL